MVERPGLRKCSSLLTSFPGYSTFNVTFVTKNPGCRIYICNTPGFAWINNLNLFNMNFFSNLFGGGNNTDLKRLIDEGAFLVDVRTPGEFAEGHVRGSVNIPLDRVPMEIDHFRNKKNVIVFCRSGNRSGQAKAILEANGIGNVTNGGSWEDLNQFVK